jgi:amino acid transporter
MKEFNPDSFMPPQENHGQITPLMIEHLTGTKPWVRLMSVILFISVALMVLLAGVLLLMPTPSPMGSGFTLIIAVVYLGVGLLYLFPAYFLHQYASAIRNLEQGGGDVAMEEALRSQKSFWRFVGIATVVVIVLYILMIVFMIMGAAMMPR